MPGRRIGGCRGLQNLGRVPFDSLPLAQGTIRLAGSPTTTLLMAEGHEQAGHKAGESNGAGGGSRTHTGLRPRDFESRADASFATPATPHQPISAN